MRILDATSLSRESSLEIILPRYLKLSTTFSSTSSMEIAGCEASELGSRWKSTSVFPRLIVRPNCLEASEKLFSMACRSPDLGAMSAQSSAKRVSWMRLLMVFAQLPKVRDGTIIAEADIYSLFHVPYCLPKDTREEHVEQNWNEDTALFDPVGDGERV